MGTNARASCCRGGPGQTCERLKSSRSFSQEQPLTTFEQTHSSQTFHDFGIRADITGALADAGITTPFPIQAMTLPIALAGSDVIGQARTGTGKTLAFGIPVLQRLAAGVPVEGARSDRVPRALVVVPTRELCVQVTEDLRRAGSRLELTLLSVYGGRAYEPQVEALRKGVDIVVGTPGRLLDLARQHHLDLSAVEVMVLDEADEMLDLGFLPDVESIFNLIPAARQTMLFSATMPGPVVTLSRRFLIRPVHIRAEQPDEGRTVPTTHQHVFRAHSLDKAEVLARVLQAEGRGLAMVFTRTKRTADKVAADLVERGFAAAAVHGDLGQGAREQALRAFRSGKIDVLVATDVAARGIDVAGVTHVVNYQCPEDEKVYLHRIGRTGRAGESGVAVTFVDWDDIARWQLVNRILELPFPDPPETYSTSAHLYEALDIPAEAKGTLPRAARTRAGLAAEEVEDLGETGRRRRAGRTEGRTSGRPDGRTSGRGGASTPDGDGTPTRRRNRKRTRGGGAAVEAARSADDTTGTDSAAAVSAGPDAAGSAEGERPRRRRRRGGRGRGGNGSTVAPGTDASVAEAS